MNERLNYMKESPKLSRKLFEFSQALLQESLPAGLLDLVNIRASQINGCAFCLDMHVKEAKIRGERELRLYHISIWRESHAGMDGSGNEDRGKRRSRRVVRTSS
jgi:AhpD family alkylhydroperoxidase